MSVHIDSTVLVAALVSSERHHEACARMLNTMQLSIYSHGITETFSTLTGSRLGCRLPASLVAEQLRSVIAPLVAVVGLTPEEVLTSLSDAEARGVRGGAIYDYLHLTAARKAGAAQLVTLNRSHFTAFRREGDPQILVPDQV